MERDTGDFIFCYTLDEPLFGPTTMIIQAIGAPNITSPATIVFEGTFVSITGPDNTPRRYERIIEDRMPQLSHGVGRCPAP
jgi:hypothetical protein